MGALPQVNMAVPEFLSWWDNQSNGAQYELVNGKVVEQPRERASHDLAKTRAYLALRNAVEMSKSNCVVFTHGVGLSPDDRTFRVPDLVVTHGSTDANAHSETSPIIVVDLVSPHRGEQDIYGKIQSYFSVKTILHYLIVQDDERRITHYHRVPGSDQIRMVERYSGAIELVPLGFSLSVTDFFGSLLRWMRSKFKSYFSKQKLGVDASLSWYKQPWFGILAFLAVIGGIYGAWGDKRPIGGFFEGAFASMLYPAPLVIAYVAAAAGGSVGEGVKSRLAGWVFGVIVFIVLGGIFAVVTEKIPGVGWRLAAMNNSDCDAELVGPSNITVCE